VAASGVPTTSPNNVIGSGHPGETRFGGAGGGSPPAPPRPPPPPPGGGVKPAARIMFIIMSASASAGSSRVTLKFPSIPVSSTTGRLRNNVSRVSQRRHGQGDDASCFVWVWRDADYIWPCPQVAPSRSRSDAPPCTTLTRGSKLNSRRPQSLASFPQKEEA
jgi:hypothetical protein